MAWLSSSFPTFLIVCPTSFFLGLIFSLFPYDYPLLWSGRNASDAHYALYEAHIRLLYASPPLIVRILHILVFLGLVGLVSKLYKPSESNMLFDGGSLVLYMCGVIVYGSNIIKGLRTVSKGVYGQELVRAEAELNAGKPVAEGTAVPDDGGFLGREDTMKVLAASNTILALILVGVLVLQSGQWYAEKRQREEEEKMAREEEEQQKKDAGAASTSSAASSSVAGGGGGGGAAGGNVSGNSSPVSAGGSSRKVKREGSGSKKKQ